HARTVPEMGWASKRNGELLALAAADFDVFVTADRNLSYQQDVSAFDIAVVVLVREATASTTCAPLAPRILTALTMNCASRNAQRLIRFRRIRCSAFARFGFGGNRLWESHCCCNV